MLDELDEMLVERLKLWEQRNKSLPERVLIYRDGVSEVFVSLSWCAQNLSSITRVNSIKSLNKNCRRS